MDIPPPPRDDESFRVFYRQEYGRMNTLARLKGGRKIRDPEQIAENGWHSFYKHWRDCKEPEAYLRTCVMTAITDELRKEANAPDAVPIDTESIAMDVAAPPQRSAASRDAESRELQVDPALQTAVNGLSPRLREVVILANELNPGERSAGEIGRILGISTVAARMRLHRAYKQLQELVPAEYLEVRQIRLRSSAWPAERELGDPRELRERPAP